MYLITSRSASIALLCIGLYWILISFTSNYVGSFKWKQPISLSVCETPARVTIPNCSLNDGTDIHSEWANCEQIGRSTWKTKWAIIGRDVIVTIWFEKDCSLNWKTPCSLPLAYYQVWNLSDRTGLSAKQQKSDSSSGWSSCYLIVLLILSHFFCRIHHLTQLMRISNHWCLRNLFWVLRVSWVWLTAILRGP